ncbi:MAG: LuxR C-terminal-related transcriptional regulator [Hydrogenophaga sp.]|nr:LuxR C-terminal-related transcriptional regulator [Hydrogenophaga sp.]
MPQLWTIDPPAARRPVPAESAAALLDVASGATGAQGLLRAIQAVVPAEYLSLVQIRRDLPELIEGSARRPGEESVVSQCFGIYRRHYYRRDALLPLAAQMSRAPGAGLAVLHCRAADFPDAGWRSDIYERERLTDRFTLVHAPVPGQAHAIHLYRDDRLGPLQADEIDRLLALSPLLCQALALGWRAQSHRQDRESGVAGQVERLARLAPTLSPRERDVCARIAQGMTVDGIAADLDVAPSTVVTLRKRAYLKLAAAGLPAERLGLARLLH